VLNSLAARDAARYERKRQANETQKEGYKEGHPIRLLSRTCRTCFVAVWAGNVGRGASHTGKKGRCTGGRSCDSRRRCGALGSFLVV